MSTNNVVYTCDVPSSNGNLTAMCREKTNDLRFGYEIYDTAYEKNPKFLQL